MMGRSSLGNGPKRAGTVGAGGAAPGEDGPGAPPRRRVGEAGWRPLRARVRSAPSEAVAARQR